MKSDEVTKIAVHFIPGDGPNGLIQAISLTSNLKVKILTLYKIDETVPNFCSENEIEIESLGFTEKNILRQIFQFLIYLYKEKPKLVFAHSFYPSLICAVARFFYWKTNFVPVRHHNRVHILSRNRKAIFLDKWISRVTTHTVGVSEAVRETLIEQGCKKTKISVIFNGLPKPSTGYSPMRSVGTNTPFRLVALGRIDWQKNYEGMLKIVSELRHGGTDLELVILGGGNQEYLTTLMNLQEELGILKHVTWLGRQPNIYKYLDEADLFIHTAIDEACPLVLIETLMYGIPIVTSNLGGSRDVIRGFYEGSDPHDTAKFCQNILGVLENLDNARVYAGQIVEAATDKFNPIQMQIQYTELSLELS